MTEFKDLERSGTNAVKKLRLEKFTKGLPFMINSNELPTDQCYLEYSNGKIELVTITGEEREFTIIRELSQNEATSIRKKFSAVLQ